LPHTRLGIVAHVQETPDFAILPRDLHGLGVVFDGIQNAKHMLQAKPPHGQKWHIVLLLSNHGIFSLIKHFDPYMLLFLAPSKKRFYKRVCKNQPYLQS